MLKIYLETSANQILRFYFVTFEEGGLEGPEDSVRFEYFVAGWGDSRLEGKKRLEGGIVEQMG